MARTQGATSTASQAPMTQRVWQSMRVMRRFSSGDLIATAETGDTVVHKYVRALASAGYLRLAKARVSGRPGSRDIWTLARDSGPLAPIRQRSAGNVFDPNTWLTWNAAGQVVRDARPPAEYELSLAHREALRQVADNGMAKASVRVLHELSRMGLITLSVSVTTVGQAVAAQLPAARSQRTDGHALRFTATEEVPS